MAMFDPIYVTEVLNDILGRRGFKLELEPKTDVDSPRAENDRSARKFVKEGVSHENP